MESTDDIAVPSTKFRREEGGPLIDTCEHFASFSGSSQWSDHWTAACSFWWRASYWQRVDIILTSSKNMRTLPDSTSGKPLTKKRNRMGHRTEPWGTPLLARPGADSTFFIQEHHWYPFPATRVRIKGVELYREGFYPSKNKLHDSTDSDYIGSGRLFLLRNP